MVESVLQSQLLDFMVRYRDLGVFIGMFLESSIVPIPSELVIIGAGSLGIPLKSIAIFGSIGSALGGIVGYSIGRFGAMPIIIKFGKYLFIKPEHIQKAQEFAQKYGIAGVLIGRLLPIVPFKVFSIAAGMAKVSILPFMVCTLIGVFPRIILLSLFGQSIVQGKFLLSSLIILPIVLILVGIKLFKHFQLAK